MNVLIENIEPEQDLLLDSESMPPQAFLLHPSSVNEMARERESLFVTALSLAGRMTATLFTSPNLEDELKDAIRFLKSDEQPPAQKIHVGATAGVDAVPLPEEAIGLSGGGGGAGTLGGACPTAQTVSGECSIGVEPSWRGEGRRKGGERAEKGGRGGVEP